jgi:hypothetical protein
LYFVPAVQPIRVEERLLPEAKASGYGVDAAFVAPIISFAHALTLILKKKVSLDKGRV